MANIIKALAVYSHNNSFWWKTNAINPSRDRAKIIHGQNVEEDNHYAIIIGKTVKQEWVRLETVKCFILNPSRRIAANLGSAGFGQTFSKFFEANYDGRHFDAIWNSHPLYTRSFLLPLVRSIAGQPDQNDQAVAVPAGCLLYQQD